MSSSALACRERIALPADSRARITARDLSVAGGEAPVIADKTIDLGRRGPLVFKLTITKDRLLTRRRYGLRATSTAPRGRLLWTMDTAHTVEPGKSVSDMGTLRLTPARAMHGVRLSFEAVGQ